MLARELAALRRPSYRTVDRIPSVSGCHEPALAGVGWNGPFNDRRALLQRQGGAESRNHPPRVQLCRSPFIRLGKYGDHTGGAKCSETPKPDFEILAWTGPR